MTPRALIAALVTLLIASAASVAAARPVTLAFTGDVALTSSTMPRGDDFPWEENPLQWMAPVLKAADLAVVNFEGVMTSRPWDVRPVGDTRLWVPFAGAKAFAPAGVDVVSLANNHAFDAGAFGLAESLAALRGAGVSVIGAGDSVEEARQPYIHPVGDGCVALLPATMWSNRWDTNRPMKLAYYARHVAFERLLDRIQAASDRCAVVAVYVHWGAERQHAVRDTVREQARQMVAAGADLIVGHHAHVLKGVEFIDGAPVAYGLGNFVFGNMHPRMRFSGVLQVEIDPTAEPPAARVALVPSVLTFQKAAPALSPRPTTAAQTSELLANMRAWCQDLGTQVDLDKEGARLRFSPQ